jgi:hypothetical protein
MSACGECGKCPCHEHERRTVASASREEKIRALDDRVLAVVLAELDSPALREWFVHLELDGQPLFDGPFTSEATEAIIMSVSAFPGVTSVEKRRSP